MCREKPVWFAWLAAVIALATATSAPVDAAEVLLAEDGASRAVLVLPAGAGRVERSAAELLQHFVKQMSGAELPVHLAEGGAMWHQVELEHEGMNFVLVGAEGLAGQLGIERGDIGPGGIRIKTFAKGVALLGGPERVKGQPGADGGGVRYAALELLDRLGCRYLWPGELGMIVPEKPTVAIGPLDYSYTPPIRRRGIRWGQNVGHRRFDTSLEQLEMPTERWLEANRKALGDEPPISFLAWHRAGGDMPTFGHAGAGLSEAISRAGKDAEWFLREHPEWFALQADGTRDQAGSARWRLCKTNPGLIEFVANDIIQRRNEDPALELVSLDPNDGGGGTSWCLCDNCRALDVEDGPKTEFYIYPDRSRSARTRQRVEMPSLSDRMVFYWNSVAEIVGEAHPDLLFGVSAYSKFTHAPVQRRLHPNLVVRYVPLAPDLYQGWRDMGARRVFWRPGYLRQSFADGKLRVYAGEFGDRLRYFVEAGVAQTDIGNIRHWWAIEGVNYYAAARMVWNPELTGEEVFADYAKHGFGTGAEHVVRYFRRAEELTSKGVHRRFASAEDYRYTPEIAAELREMLNEAERAAAGDQDALRRVNFLRLGLNYTELQERLSWKHWLANQGEPYDEELARRLVDLNTLVTRDIPLNPEFNLAVNTVFQVSRGAGFAHFGAIRGRTLTPSDPAFMDRVGHPDYGWTGREQNLEEMLAAFGL